MFFLRLMVEICRFLRLNGELDWNPLKDDRCRILTNLVDAVLVSIMSNCYLAKIKFNTNVTAKWQNDNRSQACVRRIN